MRFGSFKKAGVLSTLALMVIFASAGVSRADEWSRMQEAQRRSQAAQSASQNLCVQQASARTQIQTLANDVQVSYNTFSQRLQDNIINDVQADVQRLSPRFQSFVSKADQVSALYSAARLTDQPLRDMPGFPDSLAVTPEVMNVVRQMVDQATAIHETVGDLMEENTPLLSFQPQPSYALWLALANNKQNPSWYQGRDQAHVTLQDELDQVQRQAYAVFHNMNYASPTSADVRMIRNRFVDMRTLWHQRTIDQAKGATQEMLNALNAYPGIVRAHRAQLTQEAEGKVQTMESSLQQARTQCDQQKQEMKATTAALTQDAGTIATASPYQKKVTGVVAAKAK